MRSGISLTLKIMAVLIGLIGGVCCLVIGLLGNITAVWGIVVIFVLSFLLFGYAEYLENIAEMTHQITNINQTLSKISDTIKNNVDK